MMEKRGQVTVFVIIGIVIVAAAVTVFIYQRNVQENKLDSAKAAASAIPPRALIVKDFIDGCVSEVAREGVFILGERAGYIDVPEDGLSGSNVNFFSNNLEIFSGSGVKIPYWWYESASTIDKTQVPSLEDMAMSLEKYIDSNVGDCIDLKFFESNGYRFRTAPFVSEVEILDNVAAVKANYELYMEIEDFEFEFNVFYVEVEVPLGELYKAAVNIYNYEAREMFLENKTIDYLIVYDELPYSGVDFDCSPRIWTKTKVVQDFKEILNNNIPVYKVKGTKYERSEKYYEINALKGRKSFNVNFHYSEDWPLYIDFLGEDSELLRGQAYTTDDKLGGFITSLFCLNNYHFVYDIKYPVLIELSKDDFVFQYPMMVVIDNNQARKNIAEIDYSDQLDSFLCDKTQQDIIVYTLGRGIDGELKQVDAEVSYKCSTSSCDVGNTFIDKPLTAAFPQCVNGFVFSSKEGYHRGKEMLTTVEPTTISIVMDELKEVEVEIMALDNGVERSLAEGEIAFLSMENSEEEYSVSVDSKNSEKVKLIPGNYFVKAYLMAESKIGFKFPEQEIENCFDVPSGGVLGLFGGTDRKCVKSTIEATELDSIITGRDEFTWYVNGDELYNADKIVFYINKYKNPRNVQEMTEIFSKNKKEARKPSLR
jgi:hypothetical protein